MSAIEVGGGGGSISNEWQCGIAAGAPSWPQVAGGAREGGLPGGGG
jgi:hypothetical protein